MLDHAVLYHRNNFVLIRHLTEENKYSLGTAEMYEGYKKNTDCFPVSESFISAEEMIERIKAWQEIDKKYGDVNNTFVAEQEIIEVLERELIKETDIVIDFKKIISEIENKDFKICTVHSELHPWGLCLEDNQKNLYQMESFYDQSYLERLIKNSAVVKFKRVDKALNESIGDWEKSYMDVSDVKDFLFKNRLKPLPDDSISVDDMHAYGYHYNEMLPLRSDTAIKLWKNGCPVFLLYDDGSEGVVVDYADFINHADDGIYGVEKDDWFYFLENESFDKEITRTFDTQMTPLDEQICSAEQRAGIEHLEDLVDLPAQHKQNSDATRKVMDFITDDER